ncbi:sugar kinase [Protaetiibacter larvae]|uniref:Sugar kinase n=1 Tax=Protaetiibacter larvae TaxID=2592654 RepID=A0A5C1Y6W2_9MICO|nr:sugar kinase [Protaetiibacter larvae]QEO09536.1 sugar kinase [Protaetiibacter larvae]
MSGPLMSGPVVTLGETMALVLPAELGSLETVSSLRLGVGGAESNVAIGLARLGTAVSWLGRVGDDALGRRIVRELRAEGVEVRAIVDPAATGLMVKERRTPDATRVLYYRAGSAGSRLSVADLAELDIAGAALLHVTGITAAISGSALTALDVAVERAVAAGVPVSFDVNHRASLWGERDAGAVYRAIAARASVVFAGLDEALLLAPDARDAETAVRAIAALGPREVIIKLGADGCLALIDGELLRVPARAIRPVDTVGAGDAFVAGYLAERHAGLSPRTRLETAVTAGAFACLHPGDWEGLPRRAELALLDSPDPVTR